MQRFHQGTCPSPSHEVTTHSPFTQRLADREIMRDRTNRSDSGRSAGRFRIRRRRSRCSRATALAQEVAHASSADGGARRDKDVVAGARLARDSASAAVVRVGQDVTAHGAVAGDKAARIPWDSRIARCRRLALSSARAVLTDVSTCPAVGVVLERLLAAVRLEIRIAIAVSASQALLQTRLMHFASGQGGTPHGNCRVSSESGRTLRSGSYSSRYRRTHRCS